MSEKRNARPGRKSNPDAFFTLKRMLILLALGVSLGFLCVLLFTEEAPKAPQIVVGYQELIRRNAAEQGLDPAYVAAVVMAESSYRPDAQSADNAQGLMQLLPTTADWIAGKLGETYVDGSLFTPETNLRYGCWYLGWLMRRYGSDMTTASSAYFQGQGTVDSWLKDPQYSSDGLTLIEPVTEATRTYVDRIMRYYEQYKTIYA